MGRTATRWNHNIHYHRWLLGRLPPGPLRVLDVGCGEGMLAREISGRGYSVAGVDRDGPSIALAMAIPQPRVQYVLGDVMTHPFGPGSFDAIVSVATLHHLEPAAALARMAELLRPGGALLLVGCARSEKRLPDLVHELAAAAVNRARAPFTTYWEHSAPTIWPPAHTYRQMRAITAAALPGAAFRRRLYWRYSIAWQKPSAGSPPNPGAVAVPGPGQRSHDRRAGRGGERQPSYSRASAPRCLKRRRAGQRERAPQPRERQPQPWER